MHFFWLGLTFGALALAACKDDVQPPVTTGSGASGGQGGEPSDGGFGGEESWVVQTGSGGCDTTLYEVPLAKSRHVEECSVLEPHSNPPTSGNHYGRWASFIYYDEPIPRGYYMHSMEHGAVVLAHKCVPPGDGGGGAGGEGGASDPCSQIAAELRAFADSLPVDEACTGAIERRVIVVPDPELDVPFAAASWGHMLKAQCFDADLVGEFVDEHYADAPEDVCGGGFDPSDPAERVPPDCGE